MKNILIVLVALLTLASCQEAKDLQLEELQRLSKELELQPTDDRARAYLEANQSYVTEHMEDYDRIREQLISGAKVSRQHGFLDRSAVYLIPLIKNEDKNKNYIMDLADVMINIRKVHASNVMYKVLGDKYPNDADVQKRMALIDSTARSQSDYMQYLFDQITVAPEAVGFNRAHAMNYVDAAEAYSFADPKSDKTPDYLYKAAEVARSMRTMPKAMSLYDRILNEYPNYEKSGTVLFIKGFILEQDYKRSSEAKAIYQEFLEKYPDHDMAESVKFLLENIGKSEKDILKQIGG